MKKVFVYGDNAGQVQVLAGFAKAYECECVAVSFSVEKATGLAQCGTDQVVQVNGASARPEDYAKSLAAYLAEQNAALFLASSTVTGRELAAHVAGFAKAPMVSDAQSLAYEGGVLVARNSKYGGVVVQTQRIEGFAVVTASIGVAQPTSGVADVVEVTLEADDRIQLVETVPVEKCSVDLGKTERVVCVGNALNAEDDLVLVRQLADVLGAEVGCTRGIAEERKWLPVDQYIGISGANLTGKLYLALGVSGQAQHLYGVRDVDTVVAVNKDEKALIFRSADYGLVGDLYDIAPALIQAFK